MKKVNHPTTILELLTMDNVATLDWGAAPADYAQRFFRNINGNATGLQCSKLFKEGTIIIWVAYCTGNESDCLYMAQY